MDTLLEAFKNYLPDVFNKFNEGKELFNTPKEKEFIDACFPVCPNISIDYGIMEKADNVYVTTSDFGWSDLGTWGSLHEMAEKDENNNACLNCKALYIESTGNIVAMSDGKVVVVQGLEDYIVAESDNALLICKKSEEQRIKHFVTEVKFRFGDEYV